MIRLIRGTLATFGLAVLLITSLLGWNLWTYHRLSAEQSVADLVFNRIADDVYLVTLTPNGEAARQYQLKGDDWQLDARLVTWSPWMQLLGNDPIYRLDRLSGRYRDIDQARSQRPTVHALSTNPGLDLWGVVRDGGKWLPGVDAAYGSAVFLPMAEGAHYRVSLSARGILARPYNKDAASAISTWY